MAKIGIYIIIITPTSHMVLTARRQQKMHATEIGAYVLLIIFYLSSRAAN
jgi:hypothetical protein